jgi:ferritin-like metal-binding protein YciE
MTTTIDPWDTEQAEAGRALVVQYLGEAHATETALITTLQAHITMTPPGSYRRLLERHLAETRQQAGAIERRVSALGGGSSPIAAAIGLVETVVGQALALGKGPIDLLRGGSRAEKLLKNAKDECATEALEIATYDALEVAARAVGDAETAALARRHREQEERMLAGLREEIPGLTEAVVRERVGGDTVLPGDAGDAGDAGERSTTPDAGDGGDVPIAGYDTLNAGQVIARLGDLSAPELDAVAAHERANRARSTVLARVELMRSRVNGTAAHDLGTRRA